MSKDYEHDNTQRIRDEEKLHEEYGPEKTVYYSDHIFRFFDKNGRGYDFYVEMPPPPENKAMKCPTLKQAQITETQYYGKSDLYDEPIEHP